MGSSIERSVSVVMPAYRATEYIAGAIESVLGQTLPACEVIVVNDGCPEGSALEREIARFSDRIIYLVRPNGGPGAARNTGIIHATGEFVAFLDADDYWSPAFLERQIARLSDEPELDMVYCDATHFQDGGGVTTTLMSAAPSDGPVTLEALLAGRCTVGTSAVVARRSVLQRAGLFDEDIGNYSEDFDLWLRFVYVGGRIGFSREILAHHRVHERSLTSRHLHLPRGALRVLEKASATLNLAPAERAALERRRATISAAVAVEEGKDLLLSGSVAEAVERFAAALQFEPTIKRAAAYYMVKAAPRLASVLVRRRARRG
jgi:glycosyltransferase involved in cell wall biosynthesis